LNKHENQLLPWVENPYKLWSLEEILKIGAERYISLGKILRKVELELEALAGAHEPLTGEKLILLRALMFGLKTECHGLFLSPLAVTVQNNIARLGKVTSADPKYEGGVLATLTDAINEEMKTQLFLYIQPHKAKYYERTNNSFVEKFPERFPKAYKELWQAGNCFAIDQYSACVFHCMRAAEIGLRSLAVHLKVKPPKDTTYAQWGDLIGAIQREVDRLRSGGNVKQTKAIKEKITFCSDALSHFRNLKDAYRNHVAHVRTDYTESHRLQSFP